MMRVVDFVEVSKSLANALIVKYDLQFLHGISIAGYSDAHREKTAAIHVRAGKS